ncbi:MAG: DUF86 domain-containing protein [Prevotellaceae bacterium]|nr:DUF86 domain-containing protein [Candidatus Colivivens equi]
MIEPLRDKGRLEHVLSAIARVEEFTSGITKEQLISDPLHLHATVYNVQVIGEAIFRLTPEFKQSHPETPWALIEKMRHILVHDYYRINNDILWLVITEDIPPLKLQIESYIREMGE